MAKRVPGKEEFHETLRYFRRKLETTGVKVKLGTRVSAQHLRAGQYDDIVLATGVTTRNPKIPGQAEQEQTGKVVNYIAVLLIEQPVGPRVAVIGAGGIDLDGSEFLVEAETYQTPGMARGNREWGVAVPEDTTRAG